MNKLDYDGFLKINIIIKNIIVFLINLEFNSIKNEIANQNEYEKKATFLFFQKKFENKLNENDASSNFL